MKNIVMMTALVVSGVAFGEGEIPFSDYASAMAPTKGNPMAVEFQAAHAQDLAAATTDEKLAAFVADEASAKALLAKIKGAYDTCPVAATQAAAVSQWVMQDDPWYCLFWNGEHADGREVWAKALLACAKESADAYVKQFCLDQLRWCGFKCQAKCLRKFALTQTDMAVRDLAGLTADSLAGPCPCINPDDPVIGNWGAKLPYGDMFAGSFIFSRDENGAPKAFVLWRWGSPEWCSDVKIEGNRFSFRHPYGQLYRGAVYGCRMFAEIAPCDKQGKAKGDWQKFDGWRNPAIADACTEDAEFGEPIDLLKDGLDGWKTMNPGAKFGWSFKDGVLKNYLGLKPDGSWAGGGANLMSKRADFYDFNLEYDVRVPKKSNSGVYLRGRYECQVVDSYGQKVDRHNMAAYYGRVVPSVAAEKAPGEWQHVSVTLYKRHLTVVLNGVKIIDNAPVTGVTGGAIDANEFVPGPIYLQGDHSDADYKNMILRPAVN